MVERWEEIDEARKPFDGRVSVPQATELIAIARDQSHRIAELEARIRKASDMLEDDGQFGDRAHDARRAVWNVLAGEVVDG
jgi:hypothetical protein